MDEVPPDWEVVDDALLDVAPVELGGVLPVWTDVPLLDEVPPGWEDVDDALVDVVPV